MIRLAYELLTTIKYEPNKYMFISKNIMIALKRQLADSHGRKNIHSPTVIGLMHNAHVIVPHIYNANPDPPPRSHIQPLTNPKPKPR